MTPIYRFVWIIAAIIARVVFHRRVIGLENIPERGGFIVASNHITLADPPLVATSIRRPIHFMAKKELFNVFLLGWLIRKLNSHPIHRGFDRRAVEEAIGVLNRGEGMLIFPEGTRAKHGDFLPARPGIGIIAVKTGVPVVPAFVHGANRKKACFLRREKLIVIFGKPIDSRALGRYEDDKDGYRQAAEYIMGHISDLKKELQNRLHNA